jgi:putative ABC transport system permease protein
MKQSFYLAIKYLQFHRLRTLILFASIGLILYLPAGLHRLIVESEIQMMERADATPLIIGAKGNSTDLVINTLYFEQTEIDALEMRILDDLDETGFGYSIPMVSYFNARGFSIIGTNLDYFNFRKLSVGEGRNLRYVGECVLGSRVAERLGLAPGDSLVSSPENFMDLAGVYPLEMEVVGILKPSNTPDDLAVFTDLKTNWIMMGLGHGHQDMQEVKDPTLILDRDSSNVIASPKLFLYNKIDGRNSDSFHFHGDINTYPITSVLFVPDDDKASTLLRGRFEAGEMSDQIVVPSLIVDNLLQNIFRIKQIFNTVFILVGLATFFILGLIVVLTLRLRKDELYTMFTIGSSRNKTMEIIGFELLVLILLSLGVAIILYSLTGFFVEDFIRQFII